MPLDYEGLYQKAYKQNVQDISRTVSKGKLNTKINNFCRLHEFDRKEVIEQINSNPIVAAFFAVNPNKQNFYEKVAAEFISKIEGVNDFRNLPNKELSVSNGAVISKKDLKKYGGVSKAETIDFEWQYEEMTFYASHKYTKDEGGSQNRAYKSLQDFISEANGTTLKKTHFIAIADGSYYKGLNGQADTSRIQRLKNLAGSKQVHACTIHEIENLMRELAQ